MPEREISLGVHDYKFLLVVSCSQRKRADGGLLPAIDRYDGVYYRIVRKALHDRELERTLRVVIISARFGLIEADSPIPYYDQKLTDDSALGMVDDVSYRLDEIVSERDWQGIFVNLGKAYLATVSRSQKLQQATGVVYAAGGIGQRAAQLKGWLATLS